MAKCWSKLTTACTIAVLVFHLCIARADDRLDVNVSKIEALGGKITKGANGEIVLIFLWEKSVIRDLLDEEVENIKFSAFPHVKSLFVVGNKTTDRSLAQFSQIEKLDGFSLSNAKITDQGLAKFLARHPSLISLELKSVSITDKSLPEVGKLTDLFKLTIRNAPVTDRGLADIASLESLCHLDLSGTKISDAGLAHIAKLKNVRDLRLSGTLVTDKGMHHLAALENLHTLSLKSTSVTKAGRAELQKALPDLEIKD